MSLEILLLGLRITAALSLYVFLGLMLYVLWQDGIRNSEAFPYSAWLVLVESPADLVLNHESVYVLKPITPIGRGPSNLIAIPDTFISTTHALIYLRNGQWWLEDQQSHNGTLLNDIPIEEPVVLSAGDEFSIGRVKFRFETL